MPFRSGSLSVRRHSVLDEVPESFDRTATMALRRYAWRPIDADRGEQESFGWVNPRQPLSDDLIWEDFLDGHLAFLAVRRDRKTFSKVLFRARREALYERSRKEKGLTRLTRQHRLALDEQLRIEMLREVTPVSTFTELVWDRNTGEVLLHATGKSLCERIADLFHATFDLRLRPHFPALTGYAFISEQGLEENFAESTVAPLAADDAVAGE